MSAPAGPGPLKPLWSAAKIAWRVASVAAVLSYPLVNGWLTSGLTGLATHRPAVDVALIVAATGLTAYAGRGPAGRRQAAAAALAAAGGTALLFLNPDLRYVGDAVRGVQDGCAWAARSVHALTQVGR